jgi:uncharacterized protein YndB with AHSA1/START domain
MTSQKDFKRIIRTRMLKTGESYTTARSQLLRKHGPVAATPPPAKTPPLDLSKTGMSEAAVRAKTGKTWTQWVSVLDAAGAAQMPHREIARYLHEKHAVPGWWAQTVTVGYERLRGLRDVGQRRDGGYETNKSKTVAVPLAVLYQAFANARRRARWLPGVELQVRTARAEKSLRITWSDGTPVEVNFVAKDAGKSQVAIQHGKLRSKDHAQELRLFWTERLAALAELLVPAASARAHRTKR